MTGNRTGRPVVITNRGRMRTHKTIALWGLLVGISVTGLRPGKVTAQYGSGGGGSGSNTGGYAAPSGGYSSKTGVEIGAAAAAEAGALYLALRHRGTVSGCI